MSLFDALENDSLLTPQKLNSICYYQQTFWMARWRIGRDLEA